MMPVSGSLHTLQAPDSMTSKQAFGDYIILCKGKIRMVHKIPKLKQKSVTKYSLNICNVC